MSCNDIDFVAFDLAFEFYGRLSRDDALAKLLDHVLDIAAVEFQLSGDLQRGQVQAHQVKARDPGAKQLVMTGENGARQIVEPLRTAMTLISLAIGLRVVAAIPDDVVRAAEWACHAIGPSHVTHGAKALGVVDQLMEIEHQVVLDHTESG